MTNEKIRLLYIDDEENNLTSLKANLRDRYVVFTAASAEEGKEVLNKENIHVVIADQRMPGISGVEFLESIMEEHPEPTRMLLTGYADLEAVIEAINKTHIFKYITKPWKEEELIKAIEEGYSFYRRKKQQDELISKLTRANEQLEFMLREKLIS